MNMQKLLKNSQKEDSSTRAHYEDHSNKFLDWVNTLGIEKTYLGRLLYVIEEKFKLRRFFLVVIFSLLLSILITLNFDFVYTGYQKGEVASSDIKSPITFEFVDEVETGIRKKKAEDLVPPVYDYDLNAYEPVIEGVYRSFREMRKIIGNKPWPQDNAKKEERIKDFLVYKDKFDGWLGSKEIPSNLFEKLVEYRFSVGFENVIVRLLDKASTSKIIQDLSYEVPGLKQIIVRVVEGGGKGQEFTTDINDVSEILKSREALSIEDVRIPKSWGEREMDVALKVAQRLIVPNLTPSKQETANRKQKAREEISAVVVNVQKNQTVVSEGTVIRPDHVRVLDEIRKRDDEGQRDFESIILAIFFVSIILVFFSYVRRFSLNKVKISPKDLYIMGTLSFIIVILSKFFNFLFVETLLDRTSAFVPTLAFKYVLPVSTAAMMAGLLIFSGEVVWLFAVFTSAALTIMMDGQFTYFIYVLVGSIAAARGVFSCKKRNDIYFAGLRVGLVNMLVITIVTLWNAQLENNIPVFNQIFWNAVAGFVSGILSAFVTMTLVPLLETFFNCTTDVKLLELSNLNHPLLREMSVKALGTYHHSLVVGNMVESAAEAIGANSLLGRVACYYHDIGKTEHSNYFIENQRPGHNPHDHLSPHMSRTILIAHVKDGVELGTQYKLGKPIIDVIQQHHGTTLISFFFNKALENQDDSLGAVSEEDFRYPGPKPQFKEAALCMLADSIEAAARVLDEPQPQRVKNLVKTIIQRKFMDGQLDECNLTLRDLSTIEACFVRVLMGIYHQRVDYPKSMGGIGGKE